MVRRLLSLAVPFFALMTFLSSSAVAKQIVVGNTLVCPTATFSSIQGAVNAAAPGDVLIVCAGTYAEQVVIHKSLTVDGMNGAILAPVNMTANSTSLFDGLPLAVALLVSETTNVTIHGLIVDGSGNNINACAPDLFGIAFQNASGNIQRTTVRNFKLGPDLLGCQTGTGIFVESGAVGTSTVTISHSSVHDYQKNGITADEVGSEVMINSNVVTGLGIAAGAAQNGIQIGFGADGTISHNTVTNNVYGPCTDVPGCTAVATDILVTQSNGVSVTNNSAGVSQVPIFIDGDSAVVNGNSAYSALVFDAIRLEGSSNTAKNNTIFSGSESGILIDGDTNTVTGNTITEAPIGILKTSPSTGNTIHSNTFFDCPITIQDPSVPRIAQLLSPKR
jgi:parallel beta-helix repeat protein